MKKSKRYELNRAWDILSGEKEWVTVVNLILSFYEIEFIAWSTESNLFYPNLGRHDYHKSWEEFMALQSKVAKLHPDLTYQTILAEGAKWRLKMDSAVPGTWKWIPSRDKLVRFPKSELEKLLQAEQAAYFAQHVKSQSHRSTWSSSKPKPESKPGPRKRNGSRK